MATFSLPPRPGRDSSGSRAVQNVKNIALRVEEFDVEKNAATGVNIETGEVQTVYMVTKAEFAKLYVNPQQHTNDKARMDQAERSLKKQPHVKKMASDARSPETVIQFQSVKQLNNEGGRLVARWANAVTTDSEREFAARAQVKVNIVPARDGREERRRITAYLIDQTVSASRDSVDAAYNGRLRADVGTDPFEETRIARPFLVSVVDDNKRVESATVYQMWDSEAADVRTGIDAVFDQKVGRFEVMAMSALAAKVGMPVEAVKFDVDENGKYGIRAADVPEFEKVRQAVYEAAQQGQLAVTITPGVQALTMKHLKDTLMTAEQGGRGMNLTDRGFWEADISLQAQPANQRDDGRVFPATWQIKEARPAEFLVARDDPQYVHRTVLDLAEMAVVTAEAKGELVFTPVPGAQPAQAAGHDRDRDAERGGYVSSRMSMDMD